MPPPASIHLPFQPAPPSDQSSPVVPELLTLEPASPLLEPALPPEMPATPPSVASSPPTPTPTLATMPSSTTSPPQPASRPPAPSAPANSSPSLSAGQPPPSPGYTVVLKWCPNCKTSLMDSREFECYACQDRRYYYEEE
jgi:hypothetical protein